MICTMPTHQARVEVANTLAYYTALIIPAEKSFVVPAPELTEFFKKLEKLPKISK
jgi:hypothetical protein